MFRPATQTLLRRAPAARAARRAAPSTTTTVRPLSTEDKLSYGVVPKSDFGQYKEYSVIHTNRSLNLMSDPFQQVMRNLNDLLKTTYNAEKVAIIPGYEMKIDSWSEGCMLFSALHGELFLPSKLPLTWICLLFFLFCLKYFYFSFQTMRIFIHTIIINDKQIRNLWYGSSGPPICNR